MLEIRDALISNNIRLFNDLYYDLIMDYVSYHDIKGENSFHMLMLGLILPLNNLYDISSNSEEGKGRADIVLRSKNLEQRPNILLEFEYGENLDKELKEGFEQIDDRIYYHKLKGETICVVSAHYKKDVKIMFKEVRI
jgi:hypothetical protein